MLPSNPTKGPTPVSPPSHPTSTLANTPMVDATASSYDDMATPNKLDLSPNALLAHAEDTSPEIQSGEARTPPSTTRSSISGGPPSSTPRSASAAHRNSSLITPTKMVAPAPADESDEGGEDQPSFSFDLRSQSLQRPRVSMIDTLVADVPR